MIPLLQGTMTRRYGHQVVLERLELIAELDGRMRWRGGKKDDPERVWEIKVGK